MIIVAKLNGCFERFFDSLKNIDIFFPKSILSNTNWDIIFVHFSDFFLLLCKVICENNKKNK